MKTSLSEKKVWTAEQMPGNSATKRKTARTESPLDEAERDKMIDKLHRREGGIVDDPDDPGGLTHYGITKAGLADYKNALLPMIPLLRRVCSKSRKRIHTKSLDEMMRHYRIDHIEDPELRQHIGHDIVGKPTS